MVQRVSPALGLMQQHLKRPLLVRLLTFPNGPRGFSCSFHSYFLGFIIPGPVLLVLTKWKIIHGSADMGYHLIRLQGVVFIVANPYSPAFVQKERN